MVVVVAAAGPGAVEAGEAATGGQILGRAETLHLALLPPNKNKKSCIKLLVI